MHRYKDIPIQTNTIVKLYLYFFGWRHEKSQVIHTMSRRFMYPASTTVQHSSTDTVGLVTGKL